MKKNIKFLAALSLGLLLASCDGAIVTTELKEAPKAINKYNVNVEEVTKTTIEKSEIKLPENVEDANLIDVPGFIIVKTVESDPAVASKYGVYSIHLNKYIFEPKYELSQIRLSNSKGHYGNPSFAFFAAFDGTNTVVKDHNGSLIDTIAKDLGIDYVDYSPFIDDNGYIEAYNVTIHYDDGETKTLINYKDNKVNKGLIISNSGYVPGDNICNVEEPMDLTVINLPGYSLKDNGNNTLSLIKDGNITKVYEDFTSYDADIKFAMNGHFYSQKITPVTDYETTFDFYNWDGSKCLLETKDYDYLTGVGKVVDFPFVINNHAFMSSLKGESKNLEYTCLRGNLIKSDKTLGDNHYYVLDKNLAVVAEHTPDYYSSLGKFGEYYKIEEFNLSTRIGTYIYNDKDELVYKFNDDLIGEDDANLMYNETFGKFIVFNKTTKQVLILDALGKIEAKFEDVFNLVGFNEDVFTISRNRGVIYYSLKENKVINEYLSFLQHGHLRLHTNQIYYDVIDTGIYMKTGSNQNITVYEGDTSKFRDANSDDIYYYGGSHYSIFEATFQDKVVKCLLTEKEVK